MRKPITDENSDFNERKPIIDKRDLYSVEKTHPPNTEKVNGKVF
jgi:hypothetical protein